MPISPQSLQHVYHLLTKRESARASHTDPFHQLTHRLHRHPAPEEIFYSVHNSLKYRTGNRYSNILAYDRTAVQVDGDGYLNANVVCDGKGNWWVASQVSGAGGAGRGQAKRERRGPRRERREWQRRRANERLGLVLSRGRRPCQDRSTHSSEPFTPARHRHTQPSTGPRRLVQKQLSWSNSLGGRRME